LRQPSVGRDNQRHTFKERRARCGASILLSWSLISAA
jgi:hypothetical protein